MGTTDRRTHKGLVDDFNACELARRPDEMSDTRDERKDAQSHPLFVRSLNPMLLVDDERRYVDANAAASLFLRLPHDEICKLRVDDITPPELRHGLPALWAEFLQGRFSGDGTQALRWEFHMPDGASVAVDISSTPDFEPGRHLAIVAFPPSETPNEVGDLAPPLGSRPLTKRECEVLMLVALGNTGPQIATQLFISRDTVSSHVNNILAKLEANNRAHAIAIAMQTGQLDFAPELHEPRLLHSGAQQYPTHAKTGNRHRVA
jgi:DNA-binding CsgD family transcriptional regulator